MKTKKICCHLAFAALLTISVSNGAKASFIIDIVQSGSNVVATGSGSINLAGLSLQASDIGGGEGLMVADSSGYGQIWLGPTAYNVDLYTGLNHGPTFGSGGQSTASSGSGTGVVFNSAEGLFEVATGYSSGTEFSDTSTWNGQTFTDLGITPGTYTYTWGSGGDADFMTLNIGDQTPEPGSLYLLGLGGAGLLLYCWRKRMVRAQSRGLPGRDCVGAARNPKGHVRAAIGTKEHARPLGGPLDIATALPAPGNTEAPSSAHTRSVRTGPATVSENNHDQSSREKKNMKTKKIPRHLASLALLIIGVTSRAEASVIIDITQSGSDVVATGSGSIDTSNTSALTFLMNIAVGSGIYSGYDGAGELGLGPTSFNTDIYTGSITGPALGSGALIYASSGAGDAFVLDPGDGAIGVPTGYTSGAALSDSATWSGTTLTDLGLTPGTYVYTWGSGANLDSVTVNVEAAPEPGSVFLLGIGGVALLLYCSRKRIVHN